MKPFLQHITTSQWADLVEGRVTPDQRAQMEDHLSTCIQCASEHAQMERVIRLMRTDTSEGAPRSLIDRVRRLFQSRISSKSSHRRVVATLRFDSRGLAPAFGVRTGEAGGRQLLYSAEAYDVDVRIDSVGHAWVVSGQVLGGVVAHGRVELQSGTGTKSAAFNRQNEFTLPPVEAGHYRLILHMPDFDLELDDLKVGLLA